MGAVSAAMYLSAFATVVCVAPVQAARARAGTKSFAAAVAVAFALIVGFTLLLFAKSGGLTANGLAEALLYPAVIAGGVAALNSGLLGTRSYPERLMLVGALCAAALIPFLLSIGADPEQEGLVRRLIDGMLTTATGEGMSDADFSRFYGVVTRVTRAVFGFAVTALVHLNYWIGTRVAGRDAPGSVLMPRASELRVSPLLVWPFFASWACILASRFVAVPAFETVSWNCALILAFGFAMQGTGVAAHALSRLGTPPVARVAIAFGVTMAATVPVVLLTGVALLALLGVSEIWIPYRQTKGEDHEGNPQ